MEHFKEGHGVLGIGHWAQGSNFSPLSPYLPISPSPHLPTPYFLAKNSSAAFSTPVPLKKSRLRLVYNSNGWIDRK
ncbi:hypothetical protein NSTC745_06203 [Nostoc sp. DSM 114161]|jgi:hypothetical protein